MEPYQLKIREQQKENWDTFSSGWKKWDDVLMQFLKPVGEEMIQQLHITGNEVLLDVASGTGEPGLTLAAMLPQGKVVITDLSEGMLSIARENAIKRNVSNIETTACDVCELPFPDNHFDAITCRFGFMFFPDMHKAAAELYRVLKPGGRFVTSVWNRPEKNFWITAVSQVVKKHIAIPEHAPDAPGMFRCATPGLMSRLFQQAGFHDVNEKEVKGILQCGNAENYWTMQTEVSAPFASALLKAEEVVKRKIKEEVLSLLSDRYPDGHVAIESSSQVIYAVK